MIEKLIFIVLVCSVFGLISIAIIFDDYDQFINAIKENTDHGRRNS